MQIDLSKEARGTPPPRTSFERVIVVFQIFAYLVAALPLRLMYRAHKRLPVNFSALKQGSLIISNHQSMVDPFFVTASMPFRDFLRVLPIRFPTADFVYKSAYLNPKFFPFLKFFGCFSIGATHLERMRVIFYIRELLKQRRTVFLFPEGEITKGTNVKDLKQGIDFLVRDAASVLFVRLHGLNGAEHATGGRRHKIIFGDVFETPPQMSVDEMHAYLEQLS